MDGKDLYVAKKIMAEAISAMFKELDLEHNDNFRNWILASQFIKEETGFSQETSKYKS